MRSAKSRSHPVFPEPKITFFKAIARMLTAEIVSQKYEKLLAVLHRNFRYHPSGQDLGVTDGKLSQPAPRVLSSEKQ